MARPWWCTAVWILAFVVSQSGYAVSAHAQTDAGRVAAERSRQAGYEKLLSRVKPSGSVRVIVQLDAQFAAEGTLTPEAVQAQRVRIGRLQEQVITRLLSSPTQITHRYATVPLLALRVNDRGLQLLRDSPEVLLIQEDGLRRPVLFESVPLIGGQTAYTAGYTASGETIAVLDTGVDRNHPFLSGKVVSEACYSTTDADSSATTLCPNGQNSQVGTGSGTYCAGDGCDHGTHVAGIAAGRTSSFSGVAKDATVISIQVFSRIDDTDSCDPSPAPCVLTYSSDDISGLERVYILRANYRIAAVNMSLGGGEFTSYCDSEPEKPAIDNLRAVGIATVIASGNDGYTNALSAPACISSAVSVGATTKSDVVDTYSNSASFLSLLAPGSSIYSSIPGGDYAYFTGTSMAAPHVAGAWAVLKQKSTSASVDQILATLKNTGLLITDTSNNIVKPRIVLDGALGLGKGDFNSDGKTDIVWRNYKTGINSLWLMNGTTFSAAAYLPTVTDLNYRIEGTGDFNNDGRTDIVWRNYKTGTNSVWLMNGTTFSAAAYLPAVTDLNYHIEGTGDFNSDGKVDIIWRNYKTGTNSLWLMNGSAVLFSTYLPTVTDLNYHIEGIGDFNSDGRVDIVWRNYATGTNSVWLMNGTTFSAAAYLPTVTDLNYRIEGIGDFNNDRKVDLVWRNYATGTNSVWLMNGTTLASSTYLSTVTDLNYQIAGPR